MEEHTVSSVKTATTQTLASKTSRKIERDSDRKKDHDTKRWMISQLPFHKASDDTFKVDLLKRLCYARLEKEADEQDEIINFYETRYDKMDKEITKLREKNQNNFFTGKGNM